MRTSEGVEWALHCCLTLVWVGGAEAAPEPVPSARLAAMFELSPTYLNKVLQRLTRAGLLTSVSGPRGGVRLARAPERITVMDVVAAVEGPDPLFACAEIRQRGASAVGAGPREFARPCGVAGAMRRAELAWRRELSAQTVADLAAAASAASVSRVRANHARLAGRSG
ncbi:MULTISPECIES: Rrf2 family transcriptional regulator [Kitasatospora]|uniref:Putative Rrf2 family transcriptional regulator n=1 Tax=Kitasatospora setae (strain ATCC 33774 / DSM 43861 / JCM 3304 / KCC A-0304 / NBRC 14216 / KM-6054) TaxID=452652 RepID=E4NIS6_KITSK|nr:MULTISPECIES: Rrf2 family transcriptional regulator [Kitasatospora]BAJ32874.1 putative Rrf2 family transcriptional regulator [Kitasatospora setae KM-6054]